jgi:hypothetical protein
MLRRRRYRRVSWFHEYEPPPEWHYARAAAALILSLLSGLLLGCAVGLYGILKGWMQ